MHWLLVTVRTGAGHRPSSTHLSSLLARRESRLYSGTPPILLIPTRSRHPQPVDNETARRKQRRHEHAEAEVAERRHRTELRHFGDTEPAVEVLERRVVGAAVHRAQVADAAVAERPAAETTIRGVASSASACRL